MEWLERLLGEFGLPGREGGRRVAAFPCRVRPGERQGEERVETGHCISLAGRHSL